MRTPPLADGRGAAGPADPDQHCALLMRLTNISHPNLVNVSVTPGQTSVWALVFAQWALVQMHQISQCWILLLPEGPRCCQGCPDNAYM